MRDKLDRARRSTYVPPNPRIPEEVARAINKYLLDIAKLLNLAEWLIVVNDDPPNDEHASATINSRSGQRFAGVWVSDEFLDPASTKFNAELRTQTLIHEVLHLHFEDAWHFIDDYADNELGRVIRPLFQNTYRYKMEVGVDQLAWALVGMLPLFRLPGEAEVDVPPDVD